AVRAPRPLPTRSPPGARPICEHIRWQERGLQQGERIGRPLDHDDGCALPTRLVEPPIGPDPRTTARELALLARPNRGAYLRAPADRKGTRLNPSHHTTPDPAF